MRAKWLLSGIALALGIVLAWAWYDGGIRPVRPISETVVLPGVAR